MFRLVDLFYEKRGSFFQQNKRGQIFTWGMIGIMVVVVLMLNRVALTSPYTTTIILVYSVLCITFFWNCDFLGAISVAGTYFLLLYILGGSEIAITGLIGGEELIYATTMENGAIRVVYLLIILPILFIANQLIYSWLKKQIDNRFDLKTVLLLSVFGVTGCSFITVQMLANFSRENNIIWFMFVFIAAIIIFAGYYIQKSKQLQEEMDQLDNQNKILERNYERIKDYYATNAKLYHDMNHHLDAMYFMIQKGEKGQLKKYIESIKDPIDSFGIKERSSIDILDVVLYEAEKKAKENNLSLQIDICKLPQDILIEKKDICALFANLLDNSIEASKKNIKLLVKMIQRQMLIQIQNDYVLEPMKKGEYFITLKDDKKKHGFGMQNIKYIVQKYSGSMECTIQNGLFCVDIMMSV